MEMARLIKSMVSWEKEVLALGVGSPDVCEVALHRMKRAQSRGLMASTRVWSRHTHANDVGLVARQCDECFAASN